ncbi:PorP/SprF family type IX secretion system membrane protein [Sphingobacterium sp. LRF_L2]|uniref:PorP/SprF family type IX secretion system membrane protein n=1 Tax=Sphingobacterium sp. LRF_L2 TaxID=3369421 RepID=UPI003F614840
MKIVKLRVVCVFVFCCLLLKSYGQHAPIVSRFFQQEYLFNPALVGNRQLKAVDASLRRPIGQNKDIMRENYIYGMYGFNRHGVGLGFNTNANGAFKHTEVGMAYALHLPLDGEKKLLSFGTAAQYEKDQIDMNKIVGDVNDPMIAYYNSKGDRFDLNLGLAYTSERFAVNVAANNLFTAKDDYLLQLTPSWYANMKYVIPVQDLAITPMAAYRRMKGTGDVYDFGTSVSWNDLFALYAVYNTENMLSLGLSTRVHRFQLQVGYMTPTSRVSRIGSQGIDVGLRYSWK